MKLDAVNLHGKSESEIARILTRGTGHPWQPRDWTPEQTKPQKEKEH